MRRRWTSIILAMAMVVPALVVLTAAPASATTFSNPASIALNDPNTQSTGFNNAKATPYPSTISVSGLTGTVNHLTVSLNNVTYQYSQDLDVLLVGPGGQKFILVANSGPSGTGHEATNATLVLSDSGTLPAQTTPWAPNATTTFKPVNFGGFNETWPSPAPGAPYGDPGTTGTGATLGSEFDGTNPNGTWSLYVITTAAGDGTGAIAGGWSLDVTTASVAATTTALTSSPNPSFTTAPGNSVALTATVHQASDNSNVNEGTVAFTDGGSPIAGCGAVSVSAGAATCNLSFTSEGNHLLVATYSGTANFGPSHSATVTQVANNHTTVTGANFCNTGSIALNDPNSQSTGNNNALATPYPSNVFVSGLSGTVDHVAVTLSNVTYSHSQDIDVLLVGPGGQNLILVANLGPNSGSGAPATNATVTFSDAGVLPPSGQGTPWSALSTVKPVNYGGFNEVWGPPAPAAPHGDPGTTGTAATLASQFNGINGNGTWSLYVITTAGGDGTGAIAGGWCANITAVAAAGSTTTVVSNNNPSFTTAPGNGVTFTATVHKAADNSNVTEGTVAFNDNGTTIPGCGAVAVSAGTAMCTTSFSTQGSHSILAQYSGTTNFGPSSATLSQVVNNHTVVTGTSFCNTGSIALNNPTETSANATPYPSNVFASGLSPNLLHLTVTLENVSYSHSQDIDALLVGPGGQTFILVANAPPSATSSVSNVTLTLDDAAASTLPLAAPWAAPNGAVSYKPANFGGFNESWGPPAPSGPYGNPGPAGGGSATLGSVFNGTNPNGTWSLYVITTAAGDGTGAIAGGWCVGLTVPQPPTITKAFGASSIPLNGSTSMTIGLTNPAGNTFGLTGVGVTDTLPAGLVVATPNALSNTCGGTVSAVAGSNTVSLTGGTIAQNANCSLVVDVTGVAAGIKVNTTGNVTSTEGGAGGTATATVTVVAPPVIGKSFLPTSVASNGTSALSFAVTNPAGNAVALNGVAFTDTLPAGLVVATPNGLSGSCGGGAITAVAGSGTISLSGATLATGGSCTFSVNVTATTAGGKNNSVTVTSTNGGTGNTATATLDVATPPTIAKSFGFSSIPLNGSTSLSFTVANPAGNVTLSGLGFVDNLPAGLVVATPNGLSGTCGGGTITAVAGASSITLAGATLATNTSCTFSVNVIGTSAGVKSNSVTVTSTEAGAGNTSNATVTVVEPPTFTKQFEPSSIALNGTAILRFIFANHNPTTSLSGIGFTDTLPGGVVVATPLVVSGDCTAGGATITTAAGSSTITMSGLSLGIASAFNSSCNFIVQVQGTTAGVKVNTTSAVTSNEGGSGPAATATLTVTSVGQTITKSFGAASVPLNGSTTLSFTIANVTGNGTATGVAFTDNLPAGLVVATPNALTGACGGGTITATAGSTSVSLSGATLPDGVSCTFSVNVTGTTAGVKNNSVTVASTSDGTGNTSNASITVVAPPTLTKLFGASSVPLNGSTSLTFTVANPNPTAPLTGVGFTDTLPAGLVVSTPNGLSGPCGGGTIAAVAGSGTINLSGATLAANTSCTFSVNVTGTSGGTQVNTTSAVASVEGGNGAAATAALVVVAPPTISKQFSPTAIPLNGTSTLTFTVTNPGANTAALTGVAFTDNLPAGLLVATPNGVTGSCGAGTITAAPGSSTISLAGGSVPVSGACTFTVNVTGTTAGTKTNTTGAVSSTNGGTGNTATATLSVATPPQITKSFGAASIPLNGSTTLTFTVANPAGNQTLTGIGFTDNLPAGLVVSTPNGLTGTCGGGTITATAASSAVSLSGASLASNTSCTFSVNVTGTTQGVKNNSVVVTSANAGPGNTSNASITVVAPPAFTKAFGSPTVPLNASTSLTFTITNPDATTLLFGIGFSDTLPAGLVVATPSGLSGSCGGGTITAVAGSGTISLSGASLNPNETCTFSVNVTATAPGSKVNTTSALTSTPGGNGTPATATLVVVAPPVIAKSFAAANIAVNATTTLTFTVTNPSANSVSLTGVGFTDTLPAGLVVATPSGATGACGASLTAVAGSGTVSLSGATIPSASACVFTVNVTGTTSGVKNNSVTVTSTNGGTGNTATATVSVALPPLIAKSFGAATIALNGTTTLTFTVTNPAANGTFALTGVGFTDTLPAGLVVGTPKGLTGSCGGGTITAAAGGSTVTLTGATLTGGASCTFSVNVKGTTAGIKNNSVTVNSANAGPGNTASATITVVAPPTIAKSFGVTSLPFGGTTTLTFSLANPNATVPLSGVGFTDTLPAGLVVATPNGLTGSCGSGVITAAAGSGAVSLTGGTIPAGGACTFSVNVTATGVGTKVNTTSAVTSTQGGTGASASAPLTVTRAPTTTTVTAAPTNPSLGSPVTFTATVVPSGPNNSGVNPTGTVSFFLDGQATPVAVVPLSGSGTASFTTSGLGAGAHTVTAGYSGDTNFLPSSSTTQAMVTVTCTTTITGSLSGGLVLGPGSTCVIGGTIKGSIVVPSGALLDLEGAKVTGSITANGAAFFRMCGTTTNSVTVNDSTGFVLIGDPGDDGCAVNTIKGALTLQDNTGGVEAIGNHVTGAITVSGNSGTGPFPEDTAPEIEGNGP
ncbi:MAG: large repetitive protein [Acidimicrobiaceae bacterium]|nr:large repetitive protein [Acidimicrobiaceae bacterium]